MTAEDELKKAFPDPAMFITIIDTIVGLIANCKNKDPKAIKAQAGTAITKSLIRNRLRQEGFKGDRFAAADKVVELAAKSANTDSFIEQCLSYDLL